MAKPTTRVELVDYCKRKLGAPVLEINVDDDQIDDLVDDTFQYFNERHFDGVERMYLKYKISQDDIDRGEATGTAQGTSTTLTRTSKTAAGENSTTNNGTASTHYFYETKNFIPIPDAVVGINKIFKFDTNSISGGMFSIKYQLFLNDLYYFNSVELMQYAMTKSYLEDIDFLLTPDKQFRFNQRANRLYIDMNWSEANVDDWIIIDCYRALDPTIFGDVYNDTFVKKYLTALIKKQWGQNLIKFKGTKLPGGVELNGREIYDDAVNELAEIKSSMSTEYELPPLDLIG